MSRESPLPTPEQIFDKLVKETPDFNISIYQVNRPWTKAIIGFFHRWGQFLHRMVLLEFMNLDMVWMKRDENQEHIDLAMEHENLSQTNPIEDEWKKLVNVKANLKVLVTYESNPDRAQKIVTEAGRLVKLNQLRLPQETYFLIIGCHGEGKTMRDPFVCYDGYSFDNMGNLIGHFSSGTIPTKRQC